MTRKPIIAVVLSGCGVKDGSEIHEAVMALLAIDRNGAEARCFAPDVVQSDVVNHLTGQPQPETRNVLVEAARIARGQIRDLALFKASDCDAILFPGGFGAAKNLSNFATEGAQCTVEPGVAAAIQAMRQAGKPIGALCIAPVVIAKVLSGIEVTIGRDAETSAELKAMGACPTATGHREVVVDKAAKVVTSPCYMLESSLSDIADDADLTVKTLLELMKA